MKDEDYKNWLFNMGFITKKQMNFADQIYDLVDSDVGEEVDRHLNETNPKSDRNNDVMHRFRNRVLAFEINPDKRKNGN